MKEQKSVTLSTVVKHVPPETLKPYWRNTKKHPEEQLRKMAKLLDKHHFDQPIVVDENLVIIKGHGRYMAALMSQTKRLVPIVIRDDLTEAQINAARISDNRIFELGEAIPELIKSEVADFVAEGGDHAFASAIFDFLPEKVVLDAPAPTAAAEAKPWEKKHTDVSNLLAGDPHQPNDQTVAEEVAEEQAAKAQEGTAEGAGEGAGEANDPLAEVGLTPAAKDAQSEAAAISAQAAEITSKKKAPKAKAEVRCPHCGEIHEEE